MTPHHTKDKADNAVAQVIADLSRQGMKACVPLSEHLPFDLVAVSETGQLCRLQVKFKTQRHGAIMLGLRSSYSDGRGLHVRPVDRSTFDAYAVYCPDTGKVYYVPCSAIPTDYASAFTLRIQPSRNDQQAGVRNAEGFEQATRLFSPAR